MFSSVAYGHELYEPLPEGLFQLKLDWDPTLIFFVLVGYFYIRGLRRFKNRKPVRTWQIWCFFTGLFVLIAALVPPIDPLADRLFFMHMVQHLLIVQVGVPLLIFGVPYFVILRGMPMWFRSYVYFPLLRNRPFQKVLKFVSKPLVALILFEANFIFWHIPLYYNLALFNDVWHMLEHACMALTAMLLWRNIIDPYPMRAVLSYPSRILYLALITASDIILSSILTFADRPLYGYEGIPQPEWWVWGYVQDQALGGLIMWVPGGFVWFVAMTACFFVWARNEQSQSIPSSRKS